MSIMKSVLLESIHNAIDLIIKPNNEICTNFPKDILVTKGLNHQFVAKVFVSMRFEPTHEEPGLTD